MKVPSEKVLRQRGYLTVDEFVQALAPGLTEYLKSNGAVGDVSHPEDLVLNTISYVETMYCVFGTFGVNYEAVKNYSSVVTLYDTYMSYARFGWDDSDVYVFLSSNGLTCQNCMLFDEDAITSFVADETKKMVDHLKKHVKAGHNVPGDTIQLLLDDDEKNFPTEEEE